VAVEPLEQIILLSTFPVTNTNNAGLGSLRSAINRSNAATGQINTITFDIAGSGVETLSLQSALPPITTPVVIDATKVPGYTTNPLIELDGSAAGMGSDGLMVAATAAGTIIEGLDIHSFSGVGVDVLANNVVLSANDIGTNVSGQAASPNLGGGVAVRGSNNTIGGINVLNPDGTLKVFSGNVISGNDGAGVAIEGTGNLVEGNFIGVGATGNAAVGNTGDGVVVTGNSSNSVGGTVAGAANVISGNGQNGVSIDNTVAPPVTPYSTSAGPLTLTQFGINEGFSLATFATDFYTKAHVGPAGITFPASGGVLASDGWGFVYKFPTDQNGQNAGSVPRVSYGANLIGLAELNGHVYMVQKSAGEVLELDDSGNSVQTIVSGLNGPNGLIADLVPGPLYGHLLVSTDGGRAVYDVDPVAQTKNLLVNLDNGADGLALEPVTNTLYVVENVYGVVGYNLNTKQKVFDSGQFSSTDGMPDGISIGTGDLRLNLFINTNGGSIIQIYTPNPTVHIAIAHLGSRGDLTAVDPYDGTLLLSQSDQIDRLIPPPGSGFEGGPAGTTTGNRVEGNLIGLGFDHQTLLGNRFTGVFLAAGPTGNTIGGTATGQGNTIVANQVDGVAIGDGVTTNNSVLGNAIGTDLTGSLAAGNGYSGIWFGGGTSANTASGNLIANNGHNGVTVYAYSTVGNRIEANSIYSNTGLGIDLGNDGVTLNGTETAQGPNNWQPFPVLSAAYAGPSAAFVAGNAIGTSGATVTIDFYANDAADPRGYGQGKTYLGSTTATAGSTFQATLPTLVSPGQFVSATETSASGDTSEFSADLAVAIAPASVSVSSTLAVSVYGEAVGFVAQVGGIPATTGTIQFQVDGVNFGQPVQIDAESGLADSLTTTTLPAGTHTVSAVYSGDSLHAGATATASQTVNKAHLTVTADSKTMPVGGPIPPLTSTISGFVNGDTAAVVSGSPVLNTTATTSSPAGKYPITLAIGTLSAANYDFPALGSGDLVVTSNGQVVVPIAVSASVANPTYGQAISFSATLGPVSSGPAPGGTVQFLVDGTNFGVPVAVSAGVATSTSTTGLAAGHRTIAASYSGDPNYAAGSSSLDLTVARALLKVMANPVSVPFDAPIPPLTYSLSGLVNGDTAAVIRGLPVLATTATAGSAVAGSPYPITIDVSGLTASNYSFTGVNGKLSVQPAASITTLVVAGPRLPGQPMTVTAAVRFAAGAVPEGNVTFTDGGVSLGTVPVKGGAASFRTVLSPGQHAITAVFSGGPDFVGSRSKTVPVAIALPLTGDVTSHESIQLSHPTRARKGKTYSETVTITAIPGQVIEGPLFFILKGLKKSVKLTNASGKTHSFKQTQYPYLRIVVSGTGLLSGSVGPKQLTFSASPNNFTPVVWAGSAAP